MDMDKHVHVCTSLAIAHLLRHMRDVTTPPQQVSWAAKSLLPCVRISDLSMQHCSLRFADVSTQNLECS
jgi:hypothetical protein